jgi:hypothetical protein
VKRAISIRVVTKAVAKWPVGELDSVHGESKLHTVRVRRAFTGKKTAREIVRYHIGGAVDPPLPGTGKIDPHMGTLQ